MMSAWVTLDAIKIEYKNLFGTVGCCQFIGAELEVYSFDGEQKEELKIAEVPARLGPNQQSFNLDLIFPS